jgi:nicotinate-nucleotide adenylyltransferase
MKLGVFGGTFDPPHLGHQILAAEALHQLGLEQVLWVLTSNPPHKQERLILPLSIRLELLEAAVSDNPGFEISRVDIDRPAPHYALDTVRLLKQAYPGHQIVYLMGGDSLRDLPNWHKPQDFVAESDHLGVMRRPEDAIDLQTLEARIPGVSAKVTFIDAPQIEISASFIRRRIAESGPFRYYLPQTVYQIIEAKGLYRLDRQLGQWLSSRQTGPLGED